MDPPFDTKRQFCTLFGPLSFIEPYRFYHFNPHLSNRFYRALINELSITVPNGHGHLSTSAGVYRA